MRPNIWRIITKVLFVLSALEMFVCVKQDLTSRLCMGISQEIKVASININEMTILSIKANDCITIVIKFDNMTFAMTQRNL